MKTPFNMKVARTIWIPIWQDQVLADMENASRYVEDTLSEQPAFRTEEAVALKKKHLAVKEKGKRK